MIRKEILQGIEKSIRDVVEETYQQAQLLAPIKTGALRESAYTKHHLGYSETGFEEPYSATQEFGVEKDIPITGTQTTKNGRKYVNKRLIFIPGVGFRVIDKIKARPGKFFLTSATVSAFGSFFSILKRNLGGR